MDGTRVAKNNLFTVGFRDTHEFHVTIHGGLNVGDRMVYD